MSGALRPDGFDVLRRRRVDVVEVEVVADHDLAGLGRIAGEAAAARPEASVIKDSQPAGAGG